MLLEHGARSGQHEEVENRGLRYSRQACVRKGCTEHLAVTRRKIALEAIGHCERPRQQSAGIERDIGQALTAQDAIASESGVVLRGKDMDAEACRQGAIHGQLGRLQIIAATLDLMIGQDPLQGILAPAAGEVKALTAALRC